MFSSFDLQRTSYLIETLSADEYAASMSKNTWCASTFFFYWTNLAHKNWSSFLDKFIYLFEHAY